MKTCFQTIRSKSIICTFFFILLIFTITGCTDKEIVSSIDSVPEIEEASTEYTITTIPFYYNNKVVSSDIPVLIIDDEYFIPTSIIDETFDSENLIFVDDFNSYYVSSFFLEDNDYSVVIFNDDKDSSLRIIKTKYHFDYSWTENEYICHALGGLDGLGYLNCLEAFQNNYDLGHKVFEVDFEYTIDGGIICLHDFSFLDSIGISPGEGKANNEITKETFLESKIYGKYTTLCLEDIIDLMAEYPDIYIVTDTKSDEKETINFFFSSVVSLSNEMGVPEVMDRFIPQIYSPEMFDIIMDIYEWKSIIYTSYYITSDVYSEMDYINYAYENGIKVLTVFGSRIHELLCYEAKKRNMLVYVHTYNTLEDKAKYNRLGVYGLYTDFLIP